jgi:hypothetical protein
MIVSFVLREFISYHFVKDIKEGMVTNWVLQTRVLGVVLQVSPSCFCCNQAAVDRSASEMTAGATEIVRESRKWKQ